MVAHSGRKYRSTPSQNTKQHKALRDKSSPPSSAVVTGVPGFVVWLSAPNGKTRGFITWAETAVAELSPAIQDAWHFPTVEAANVLYRALLAHRLKSTASLFSPQVGNDRASEQN